MTKQQAVAKKILHNGLTILVHRDMRMPKVAIQLWYGVGSKFERSGQRGFAHFIEHLMFKGTARLSESDISAITTKLSGSCNAFTAYDYTAYEFQLPSQQWCFALDILADCMENAAFEPELINSELKAVIQELKMYRDDYESSAGEAIMEAIFPTHPYHYPIIGTKDDLLNSTRDGLIAFYKQHYVPDNATLVLVGDVEPDEVFDYAQKVFGRMPKTGHSRVQLRCDSDVKRSSIVLQRDVQQPSLLYACAVPGVSNAFYRSDYAVDTLVWMLAAGRGSRLYKELVEKRGLAANVAGSCEGMFDQGVFAIQIQPINHAAIEQIDEIVRAECARISDFNGAEFARAQAKLTTDHLAMRESLMRLAYAIGRESLATNDPNAALTYLDVDPDLVGESARSISLIYLRPSVLHRVCVEPFTQSDRSFWLMAQQEADAADQQALAERVRTAPLAPARVAPTIVPVARKPFTYPHFKVLTLSNGLEVVYHCDAAFEKIEAIFEFKGDYLYDPDQRQGLSSFASALLTKGTKKYTAQQLADLLEGLGMTLESTSGFLALSMLSKDFSTALEILSDIVCNSTFEPAAVERVREHMLVELRELWDEPYQLCDLLVRQKVYAGHPYSHCRQGADESLQAITRDELVQFYRTYINPRAARLALVGNLPEGDLQGLLEKFFACWQGPEVPDLAFPAIAPSVQQTVDHYMDRDQVTLAFAGPSVSRVHPDFDPLLVFDQVFGFGVLGSMSSRLFNLREQTGLFYTINGSTVARADKQPGMVFVKTIVSLDRLAEAERAVAGVIDQGAGDLTDDQVRQSKDALINSLVDHFESYRHMAFAFLHARRFGKSADYFDKRADEIEAVSIDQIRQATARVMHTKGMVKVRIGRVGRG